MRRWCPVVAAAAGGGAVRRAVSPSTRLACAGWSFERRARAFSSAPVPDSVDTVICGSGVIGSSIAYHMAQRGHGPGTLLLEPAAPGARVHSSTVQISPAGQMIIDTAVAAGVPDGVSGPAGHSPPHRSSSSPSSSVSRVGLVSTLQPYRQQSYLVARTQRLYRRLHQLGHDIGLSQSGCLHVARSPERLHQFRRQCAALAAVLGVPAHVLTTPAEVQQRCPLLAPAEADADGTGVPCPAGVTGAAWLPDDISVSPPRVAATLRQLSAAAGVRVLPQVAAIERVLTTGPATGGDSCGGDCRPRVAGVRLTDGTTIACRRLVNATGGWSRQLAQLSEPAVRLPVLACEHYALSTDGHAPWRQLPHQLPAVCDPAGRLTLRVNGADGVLMADGIERVSRPLTAQLSRGAGGATGRATSAAAFDWQRLYAALLRPLLQCVPSAREARLVRAELTPESYSPDGHWTLGQAGELRGYYVAAGLGAHGTAAAGGVGELLAAWILDADALPPIDVHQMDVRRFLELHNNSEFLRNRMCEVPSQCVRVAWPFSEYSSGRRLRTSPIFSRLSAAGAQFGAVMGYERPTYFDTGGRTLRSDRLAENPTGCATPSTAAADSAAAAAGVGSASSSSGEMARQVWHHNTDYAQSTQQLAGDHSAAASAALTDSADSTSPWSASDDVLHSPDLFGSLYDPTFRSSRTDTFFCPPWFQLVAQEYEACRERVAISDYSSFTKVDLTSRHTEVVQYLQRLCSNDVDIPVGNIVHSGMQNARGGYENDCSLARLAHNHFMMICPTVQHARCQWWLRQHLPADGSVVVNDVTSLYTALCVMGPLARELLAELTTCDLQPKQFPFFTFKEIDVGMVSGVRAMNMTHTGELGWVLYVPNEFALYVYDLLTERGREYGLTLAGYLAMRSLRVEKFYAFWGQDLGTTTTPLECGRAFRVKFAKQIDFIGRRALERQRAEGVRKLYVHFTVLDHNPYTDPWPWGSEPILRDGRLAGVVTTTSFGFSLGRMVCLGFVQDLCESAAVDGRDLSSAAARDICDTAAANVIQNEFVLRGQFHIRIGDRLFPAKPSLVSPSLTTKSPEPSQRRYQPTQHISA